MSCMADVHEVQKANDKSKINKQKNNVRQQGHVTLILPISKQPSAYRLYDTSSHAFEVHAREEGCGGGGYD